MKLQIKFEPNWIYEVFPEYSAAMWTFNRKLNREECASVSVGVRLMWVCVLKSCYKLLQKPVRRLRFLVQD